MSRSLEAGLAGGGGLPGPWTIASAGSGAVGVFEALSYSALGASRGGAVEKAGTSTSSDDVRLGALMAAAQGGDQAAYRLVLTESIAQIRRVARRTGVPAPSVDDVVQEALLSIHRMLATFDPGRSYLAWLSAIAKRRSIDVLRSQGRRASREVYDQDAYDNHPDDGNVEEGAERRSEARLVGAAVRTLPDGQREAVEVLALGGRSLEEAAEATGKSKTALKVNLHRAIQNLRSRLGGAG